LSRTSSTPTSSTIANVRLLINQIFLWPESVNIESLERTTGR